MELEIETKHKDALFQLAFNENREAALSLYNAINKSHYTDVSQFTYQLLGRGFYMGMANDNGFIIDQTLNVFEHQSSINPNMPLRGFFYYSDLYKEIIYPHSKLHGKTLVKIPTPQYIVFYNGTDKMDDVRELKLSDAFMKPVEDGKYEWTATMFNINVGHNEELMKSCKVLNDYAYFVHRVRELSCYMILHDAIIKAAKECISKGIFVEVLEKYKEQVAKMTLWEFNEEEVEAYFREEGREEGRAEGRAEALAESQAQMSLITKLLDAGRYDDAKKASSDEEARKAFFIELGMGE